MYYSHYSSPEDITDYCSISLSTVSTVNVKFTHVQRNFLGEPYTKCKTDHSDHQRYTENGEIISCEKYSIVYTTVQYSLQYRLYTD